MTDRPKFIKKLTVTMQLTAEDLAALQDMVDEAKAEDPIAFASRTVEDEAYFIIRHAIDKKQKEMKKEGRS